VWSLRGDTICWVYRGIRRTQLQGPGNSCAPLNATGDQCLTAMLLLIADSREKYRGYGGFKCWQDLEGNCFDCRRFVSPLKSASRAMPALI
jgi:hypothetical protein